MFIFILNVDFAKYEIHNVWLKNYFWKTLQDKLHNWNVVSKPWSWWIDADFSNVSTKMRFPQTQSRTNCICIDFPENEILLKKNLTMRKWIENLRFPALEVQVEEYLKKKIKYFNDDFWREISNIISRKLPKIIFPKDLKYLNFRAKNSYYFLYFVTDFWHENSNIIYFQGNYQ